jgi:hypothetical protein
VTTYVQDPVTKKFVEKSKFLAQNNSAAVHTMEPFKSPIDGSIIRDPASLRAHNIKHGVTDSREYGPDYFERKRKEMAAQTMGQTPADKANRIEILKHLTENHNRR